MSSSPLPAPLPGQSLDEHPGLEKRCEEFLAGAAEPPDGVGRRRFLQLMAASFALAGGGACTRQPREEILPYVRQPEGLTSGVPLFFATAMAQGGDARGLLVRSDEGRPTKIEGNPDHPETLGRSSVHMQAALLDLYDPDRSQTVLHEGQPATWEDLLGALAVRAPAWQAQQGRGLRLLTRRVASPTLRAQIAAWLEKYPEARWHVHDPAFPSSPMPTRLHLDKAEVLVTLEADLFGPGGWEISAAAAFAKRRRSAEGMSRLYALESTPTLTGAMADHREALTLEAIVQRLEHLVDLGPQAEAADDPIHGDLWSHAGRCVVVAGESLPWRAHVLARALNEALGNVGETIDYLPVETSATLAELSHDMHAGAVTALVILEANPLYDAPADLDFAGAIGQVPWVLHSGPYDDETAARALWHVPQSHFLEAWSDLESRAGSLSIGQPLIQPLYPSRSAHEVLAALLGDYTATPYDMVRVAWGRRFPGVEFERVWRQTLRDGIAPGKATTPPSAPVQPSVEETPSAKIEGLHLLIRPDAHLLDGRFANNGWLQELPKPFTQLTWENAAHIAPSTAERLALAHGDVVELRYRGRVVEAPLWFLPGQVEDCVTIHLGYGRSRAGRAGTGAGFNAFLLQTSDAPWGGPGLELRATGRTHTFATTQVQQSMEDREPVRILTAAQLLAGARVETEKPADSLYPTVAYERPAWGMAIDLSTCIGCAACTIACQAENNIPVVGREQVLQGRAMHWIRVDRYFDGPSEEPCMVHQPVPCMHCENAPCELVCPVAATVHDHDGLNLMVYNRCVGTRYCSNNCPYKVRRFNFLQYADNTTAQLKLMRNPEVSVRSRGVMEKCTYCVQRIQVGKIAAEKENRPVRDGEVVPACAQACPTEAIVFGDTLDPASRVAAQRRSPRQYALLGELNTRPRTTYLARVRNPDSRLG